MPFPIIPIAAITVLLGGTGTLAWYFGLSHEDKDSADEKANEYAQALFKKALDKLTRQEAKEGVEKVQHEIS